MKSVVVRPASSRLFVFWILAFVLSLILFGAAAVGAAPVIGDKIESVRYRILAMLPPPPHTEFVPTPLPTPTAPAETTQPTETTEPADSQTATSTPTVISSPTPTRNAPPTPAVALKAIQPSVHLTGYIHDYQRWNNCGPTTLEMGLSFFGHREPQVQIASVLKPDPDDKNVRPDEMAAYVRTDGLNALVRVNGTVDRIKLILSNGLPVIVETGFDPPQAHEGWMGHYRLVTAYDDKNFITQDSYDGPNVPVAFDALDADWKAFNRTYLLIYTNAQSPLVQAILGNDMNDVKMYTTALARAQTESAADPQDAFAAFNMGSSLLGLGRYNEAASAFDHARLLKLPWRMLWYQFGPYVAYYRTGRYDEVLGLTNATLAVVDDLEESHYYRGLALQALGRTTEARAEFTTALRYNKNYADAQQALAKLNP
ncbi:MAG: C39 family peptidase [Anaerolineae bacterium]